MEKRIIFVGISPIQGAGVTHLEFDSDNSLLDGDIVVFSLDLSTYSVGETFQGLPCLIDDSSFSLQRQSQHWKSELGIALEHGKTVIVHLTKVGEVSVATGEKQYSGTGRNARVTRIVTTFEPYSVIPAVFGKVVRRSGEVIKASADLGILSTYWHEFGPYSAYECYSRSNNEKSPPRSRQHQPKKATEVEQKLLLSGSTLQLWLHWTKPQGARRTTPRLLHGPKKVATRCKEKSSFTLRLLTMLPGFKSCKNGADS